MFGWVLIGSGRAIHSIPEAAFREAVVGLPVRMWRRDFMKEAHIRIREYVVREIQADMPIAPLRIAADLDLPVEEVFDLLSDLERNLFFLVRGPDGSVTWAFPVTAERTPHELAFRTGERVYAA